MLKYKKYQNKNTSSSAYGKWYGRLVHELLEFDIRGVLIEMETCLRELLLEGKAVRIDELGIFALGVKTNGELTADKFTADSIKGVNVNLFLGKRFRARNLFADARFKEADKYIGDGNYYEPDGETADTGSTGDAGNAGDGPINSTTIPGEGD